MGAHEAPSRPLAWLRAPSTKTRRYLYRVSMALGPLLILYGVLGTEEWAVWLGVAGAILDLGTNVVADANVPPQDSPPGPSVEG